MSGIYGSWASRRDNIVELGTLTTTTSTDSVEVSGTKFTFAHTIVGTNIKTLDEGSIDGTNWFPPRGRENPRIHWNVWP